MIEVPTVFLLGAGAHCSYGFPSGEELKARCVEVVEDSLSNSVDSSFMLMSVHGVANDIQVAPARCEAFAQALKNSGQASIDAFLNANRHQAGFQVIGKGAIAQALLDFERTVFRRNSDDDWLKYLFHVMMDGINSPEQFIERNKIGFITFNYDRLLETWLAERIKYSFGLDDDAAFGMLRQIPIHHVYGMLGPFPNAHVPNHLAWIDASRNIRTIFDTEHDPSTLSAAKALLTNARKICLLGFGFHSENIDLLDLATYVKDTDKFIASSSFGITETEWVRLTRPFKSANSPRCCRRG